MPKQQFYIIANILMIIDGFILIAAGYVAYFISIKIMTGSLIMAWNDFLISIIFLMFFNNFAMGKFGFYSEKRFSSYLAMIKSLTMVVLFDFTVYSAAGFLMEIRPFPRIYVFIYFIITLFLLNGSRILLYFYLDRRALNAFNSRQILVVGTCCGIRPVVNAISRIASWGQQVAGCIVLDDLCDSQNLGIPVLGKLDDFDNVLREHQIDEVFFAMPSDFPIELKDYLKKCKKVGIVFRVIPGMFDWNNSSLKVESLHGIPTIVSYSITISALGLTYKKILDILASITGCLISIIIYPIVGLAIKIDSPGPVLFKQLRVGLNNRHFYLFKFRSMVANAESKKSELLKKSEMNGPIFKIEKDPRITRVGKFLRKTSLDEFPQFINVLKGEMSLVGTRPPTLDEVEQYEDWHRRRISMKPGLTGLWQVSGRNKINDFDEVVKLDLLYIDNWRFINDLIILWKTVWVVLARKGAK